LARFVFNLETLLRYREEVEQKERDVLFRLTYKHQMELSHKKILEHKLQETAKELGRKQAENTDRHELTWFFLYRNRLDYEIGECEIRLSQLQSDIQAQKNVLIEASKKRKTLAAMKAKKERAYRLALEKQEQKEVDELVVARYAASDNKYASSVQTLKNEKHTK
jgi:flagellar export protein FliJ